MQSQKIQDLWFLLRRSRRKPSVNRWVPAHDVTSGTAPRYAVWIPPAAPPLSTINRDVTGLFI